MTNPILHGSRQSLELQLFDCTVQVLHVWFLLAGSVSIATGLNTSKPTLQRVLEAIVGGVEVSSLHKLIAQIGDFIDRVLGSNQTIRGVIHT